MPLFWPVADNGSWGVCELKETRVGVAFQAVATEKPAALGKWLRAFRQD